MNRLLTSVTVHLKNGEKQKLALVETERDYVIAPYFISESDGWNGSGIYLNKSNISALDALELFVRHISLESDSIFVDRITF